MPCYHSRFKTFSFPARNLISNLLRIFSAYAIFAYGRLTSRQFDAHASIFYPSTLSRFLLSPFLDTADGERGVSSPCFPLLDTRYSRAAYLLSHFPISSDAVFDTGWHDMRENTRRAVFFFGRDGCSIHRSIQRAWSKGILTDSHQLLAFTNPALFRYLS